jgi:hypothetical protein
MRTKRTKVATAVVAILLGGLLTLFATSGPAIGFFSAGLFLDVQVESPARLLARGAAIEVPLEVTCSGTGSVDLFVSVSQRSGSGVAEGFGFESVPCSGSGEQVTVTVQASGGKAFKRQRRGDRRSLRLQRGGLWQRDRYRGHPDPTLTSPTPIPL